MDLETNHDCKGYFEWFLTRETIYNEITGKPLHSTNEPVSEQYIPWMTRNISYCLATILFQIRSDEEPYHKDVVDIIGPSGNSGGDIRSYSLIKPELEFCKCGTWSEEDHTGFCHAMEEFASLGLKLNILFDYNGCLCKIPYDYEIPKKELKITLRLKSVQGVPPPRILELRRWETRDEM